MSTPQPRHHMHLDKTHPSGAEEWVCPTCAQRYLISWSPRFKRTVLETGDENALHSGSKGDLQMGSAQIEKNEEGEELLLSPEWKEALSEILDDIDF